MVLIKKLYWLVKGGWGIQKAILCQAASVARKKKNYFINIMIPLGDGYKSHLLIEFLENANIPFSYWLG